MELKFLQSISKNLKGIERDFPAFPFLVMASSLASSWQLNWIASCGARILCKPPQF